MPIPIALKTQLETIIPAQIYKFAGVNSEYKDPDLSPAQQVKEVTGGYLLLPQDRKKGPLIRLKLMEEVKAIDEIGNGEDGRSAIYNGVLRIVGISTHSPDLAAIITDRNMLCMVVLLDLLKALGAEMTIEAQNLTGGKGAYVAELNHLKTTYDEELTDGETARTADFVALFTQDWEVKIEQTTGF
jgi:hypothetical protein